MPDELAQHFEAIRRWIEQQAALPMPEGLSPEEKKQLQTVNGAIEQLTKLGVAVPEDLRSLKLRLSVRDTGGGAREMEQRLAAVENIFDVLNELAQSARTLKERLKPSGKTKRIPSSSGASQTTQHVLASCLLDSLTELGGAAHCNDVLKVMERKLQNRFLPGDLEADHSFGVKWKHNAHWARLKLANDGVLVKKSPLGRGIWQLQERAK